MTDRNLSEEFLESELIAIDYQLKEKVRQLQEAGRTIQFLEGVIHKASVIAGHMPYLCATLTEGSAELELAALQLQRILLHRET